MDYRCVLIAIMLTSTTPPRSSAITTHHFPKNFRRHAGPPPPADWEWALREAAYQALVREGYSEPSLHDYIFDAPMSGRTHGASPFGDVAMLARGQLYLTQSGFHFVQDPNAYDCDYCSPTVENRHKPIAVWTVRRIRHRDQTGHRHELEYTVSPVRGGDYATENGNYNYALPGHVFVVVTETNDRAKYHNRYDVTANRNPHRGYLPVKAENRDRHYLPPHTTPQSIDYYKPGNEIHKSQSDLERELELYKKLVQSLAMKAMDTTTPRLTTTTYSHTTSSDFDIFEDVTPLTAPVTVKTTQSTTPVDVTTIVHLTTPIVTSRPQTTPKTLASPTTQTTPPLDVATIVHVTTPIVTSRPQKTSNIVFPTTPFIPSPTYVVYSEPDPLYSSTSTTTNQQTKPPTFTTTTPRSSTTRFSKSKPTHRRKATDTRPTKATSFTSIEDDIFGSLKPPEIQPQPPKMTMTYPESIEQLPPPEKDADATTAYVGEIVTETLKLTQPTSPRSTIKTTKKYVRAKKPKGTKQLVATITTHKKPITTTKTPPTKQLPNVTVTIKPTTQSTHNVNEELNKTSPMVQTVTEEITLDEITIKSIVTEEITMKIPPTTSIIIQTTRAPPTTSKIAPTTSKIPTTSNIPPTTSKIPPTTSKIPPMTSKIPPTTSKIPTTSNAPPTTSNAPPTTSKIPTTSNVPPTTSKIPPTTTKISPTTTHVTEEIATTSEPSEDESSKSDETTQTPTRVTKPETGTKQSTTVEIETETERLTTEATAVEETTQIDNTSTPTSQISMDEIATTKVTTYIVTTDTQIVTITTTLKPDETTTKIDQTTPTTAKTTRRTLDALDEIFGEVATENKPTSTIAPTKPKNTEEIDELFDDKPRKSKKRLVLNAVRPVTAPTPKIIYSNFYAAATDDMFVDPDLTGPPTSQSYSTSVSFEVNKKTGPSVRAKVVEVDADDPEYSVFRAESPDKTTETTTNDRETTKVFDEIALSLVNHARSIDYVSTKE